MVNSCARKDFSVFTPSCGKTRTHSQAPSTVNSFHMANPNPQGFDVKHKGVRDMGYSFYEKVVDPTDVVKFGKRVNYESKLTSDVVMDEHLKQMRDKLSQ